MILKTFVEMHEVKGFCIYFFHFSWRSETAEKQQRQERTRAFMTTDFPVFFYDGSSNKYVTVSKTVFTEFTGLCEKICFKVILLYFQARGLALRLWEYRVKVTKSDVIDERLQ